MKLPFPIGPSRTQNTAAQPIQQGNTPPGTTIQPNQPVKPTSSGKAIQQIQTKTASVSKKPGNGLQSLQKGMTSIIDLIAPSSIEVDYKYVRIGELVLIPRFLSQDILDMYPLAGLNQSLTMTKQWILPSLYPTSSSDVLADLRRKIAEMEATISSDSKSGHPIDPKIEASLQDALGLQEELAKGIERFFQF